MNSEIVYDSTKDTQEHIDKVARYLTYAATNLVQRGLMHDASKLESPEKEYFDKYTPRLIDLEYGTSEYTEQIKDLKPAIDHHCSVNSHHMQYYENGINGMNLFDIIEMFFDWKAATERGINGDIMKSIAINAERHGISKQLRQILINTENFVRENETFKNKAILLQ